MKDRAIFAATITTALVVFVGGLSGVIEWVRTGKS